MSFVSFPHPPFPNGQQGERDDWMTQHDNAIAWRHRIIYAIMLKYLVSGHEGHECAFQNGLYQHLNNYLDWFGQFSIV